MDPNLESPQPYGNRSSLPLAHPQDSDAPSPPEPTTGTMNQPSCPTIHQRIEGLLSNIPAIPKIFQHNPDVKSLPSNPSTADDTSNRLTKIEAAIASLEASSRDKTHKLIDRLEALERRENPLHKSKRICVGSAEPYPEHAIALPNGKHMWFMDKENCSVDPETINARVRDLSMEMVATFLDETVLNEATCLRMRKGKKGLTFNGSGGRVSFACDACVKLGMPCIRMHSVGYSIRPYYNVPAPTWV